MLGSYADKPREELPSLKKVRDRCMQQLEQMRSDHMRRLNPTPYKVSVVIILCSFSMNINSVYDYKPSDDRAGECQREAIRLHSFPVAQ